MIPFNCLTFSILCMVVGAPVAWLIGRRNGRYAGIFAFLVMIASFVGFAVAWFDMAYLDPTLTHWEALPWFDPNIILNPSTPRPWVFGLLLDSLSLPIATIVLILTTAATCYSIGYMREEHGRGKYFALLLLYNAGILGVILATNLLEFYLFWELMLIPSYFLIAQWGSKPKSVTIAFKYFIFTHVGAVCIILAIAGVWTLSTFPTLNMASAISTEVISLTNAMANPALLNLVKLLVVLFLLGFSVKMAIVPIHTWLPDAHAEAPTPISVILSGVMIETAAYAIVRILMTFTLDAFISFAPILSVFGVITMIYGGIMALAQKDTKRLFAYSSISQMGYIFFGLSTVIPAGVTGATFHIFTHALGKGLLFMTAGALMLQVGHEHGRDITAMGGLARTMPWTATVALIAALSIAGTPPLAGFASEWIIFAGGAMTGNFFIVLFAIASTVLTASYVLWFIRRVFFGPTPPEMERIKDTPWTVRAPMLVLAVLAIVIGIWPALVVNPIYQAIAAIFGI